MLRIVMHKFDYKLIILIQVRKGPSKRVDGGLMDLVDLDPLRLPKFQKKMPETSPLRRERKRK